MNKKIIISVIIVGIIAVAVIIALNKTTQTAETGNSANNTQNNNIVETAPVAAENKESAVKEFTMTSFTEIIDEQYYPRFSLKEITVNKGDLVRIKIPVTSVGHDFKIDEFNVATKKISAGQEDVVEFTADKSGSFEFYCSIGNHRAMGMKGILMVDPS